MDGLLSRGKNTEVDHSRPVALHEHQRSEIAVARDEKAPLVTPDPKQFGVIPKMKLVIPYQIPFLAKNVGAELTEGVYAATDFWWTLEDKYPLAKMFVDAFRKK